MVSIYLFPNLLESAEIKWINCILKHKWVLSETKILLINEEVRVEEASWIKAMRCLWNRKNWSWWRRLWKRKWEVAKGYRQERGMQSLGMKGCFEAAAQHRAQVVKEWKSHSRVCIHGSSVWGAEHPPEDT